MQLADLLTQNQAKQLFEWLPDAQLIADLSWGLMDSTVLHIADERGDYVLKASRLDKLHVNREFNAHQSATRPLKEAGRAGELLHADLDTQMLVLGYMPGTLVQDTSAEFDPDTHRQAGELLRLLHDQAGPPDSGYEAAILARSIGWLDGPHRIDPDSEDRARVRLAAIQTQSNRLVPTHGDWHPRNWLIQDGVVSVIDFGRFDYRPAYTDFLRLTQRQWIGRPDLEAAFIVGYGYDPRPPDRWQDALLIEAIATACWAYMVGDEEFEQQGHRMIAEALSVSRIKNSAKATFQDRLYPGDDVRSEELEIRIRRRRRSLDGAEE